MIIAKNAIANILHAFRGIDATNLLFSSLIFVINHTYIYGLHIIHVIAKFMSLEICTSEKLVGIRVGEQPFNKRSIMMNLILVMVALPDLRKLVAFNLAVLQLSN